MNSGIYCYENKINGKKYVGQAINLKNRIAHHESYFKKDSLDETYESPILWRAVKKYGRDNFVVYVLEYVSSELLDQKEIYYIELLGSHYLKQGYNFQLGGLLGKRAIGYKKSKNTSKYFGVYLRKRRGYTHWICNININGIQKELGYFQEEVFSALYYDNFVIKNGLQSTYPLNFSDDERMKIQEQYDKSTYKPKVKRSTASSKFIGVRVKFVGKYKYYLAFIKGIHIGNFKEEKDAALAYNNFVIQNNLSRPLNQL